MVGGEISGRESRRWCGATTGDREGGRVDHTPLYPSPALARADRAGLSFDKIRSGFTRCTTCDATNSSLYSSCPQFNTPPFAIMLTLMLTVGLTPSRHDVVSRARLTARPLSGPEQSPALPFACSRRAFASSALALSAAAARPFASVASIKPGDGGDGTWAEHTGAFDDDFFKGFKSTDTGFKYKFITPGEGEKPREQQNVYMHYTGYLLDGTEFDTSYDGKGPFKFRLGEGKVITGWESIIYGMKPGQKVRRPHRHPHLRRPHRHPHLRRPRRLLRGRHRARHHATHRHPQHLHPRLLHRRRHPRRHAVSLSCCLQPPPPPPPSAPACASAASTATSTAASALASVPPQPPPQPPRQPPPPPPPQPPPPLQVIVTIPPEYAYGDKKQDKVPAGST